MPRIHRFLILAVIFVSAASHALAAGAIPNHPWWRGDKATATLDVAGLVRSTTPLLDDGSASLQRARLAGDRAPATVRALALMVAFSDTTFYGHPDDDGGALPNSTQSEFLYAAHDVHFYTHLLQDVADYYTAASGGAFTFDFDVHASVFSLNETMGFYGNHPTEGEQPMLLARDAVVVADLAVDFSGYDTLILIHAGAGEETDGNGDSPEQIYSAYLGAEDFALAVEDGLLDQPYLGTDDHAEGDGMRHVLVLPECEYQDPGPASTGYFGSLGVYCFELGLRLGMLSLFDFTGNDSQGIGQMGLMGFGLWSAGGLVPPAPCAFNKQLMGWLDPQDVDIASGGTWLLDPAADVAGPRAAARVDISGAEYYLLEYRLQDPDGNNRFSFEAGDLNGNGVPDFYDADGPDGVPVTEFDPATDTPERFLGAEWDFFLTDYAGRSGPYKGAGSGLLIWHIDEGVIRRVWDAERNLFNADPDHKSVDLEEADGFQDLDSRRSGVFWLGADVDTWKLEGNSVFSPDTRPDTRATNGAETGLVIDQISAVVVDSVHVYGQGTDDEYTGILFSDTMSFRCTWREGQVATNVLARDLVDVDLGRRPLRAAVLCPDEAPVVVATADAGRVFAYHFDLTEANGHDGNPSTDDPLCVGTDSEGAPVAWLGAAAVGRFIAENDDQDLVLAAAGGLYVFRADGMPAAVGDAAGTDVGLVAPLSEVTQPPVLLPLEDGQAPAMVACLVTVAPDLDGAPSILRFLDAGGDELFPPLTLPGLATSAPVFTGDMVVLPVVGHDGKGLLAAYTWPRTSPPQAAWQVELDLLPGDRPLTVTDRQVLVSNDEGRVQPVLFTDAGAEPALPWSESLLLRSPIAAGGAVLTAAGLGRVGDGGAWRVGWPYEPAAPVVPDGPEPLTIRGADGQVEALIFGTDDGRLYLSSGRETMLEGGILAGPAGLLSPVLRIATTGEEPVQLMTAGSAPAIAGVNPDDAGLVERAVARFRSWELDLGLVRPQVVGLQQVDGSAAGRQALAAPLSSQEMVGAAAEMVHLCYPQPLRDSTLRVRGLVADDGWARAVIFTLTGEVVRDTGRQAVLGGTHFELEVALEGVASGVYLCKLEANGRTSAKTIAVER